MSTEILNKNELRQKLLKGVETLATAVKTTLGPKGRNVIFQTSGNPVVTKDGISVANCIDPKDPYEKLGVQIVREAAAKTASVAGDGTTTATVLAEAIYKEGLKLVASGYNPVLIKRGMDWVVDKVIEYIDQVSKPINTDEQLKHIATISANNDTELGNLICEAIIKTGKDGNITVDDSSTFDSSFTIVEGLQYNRGYISQYFINDPAKLRCVMDNPLILIHERKISNVDDIFNILQISKQTGRPLFIIADDVEGEALTMLVINNARGVIKACVVKNPGYGIKQKENLTDISIHTGATTICVENNVALQTATMQHLGSAKQIIVTRDSFTIIEGNGDPVKINKHVNEIKAALEVAPTDLEKNNLKERLAKLTGGVGIIRVGGVTESEIKEKKDRIDDALHATKAALEGGIVAGGGSLLAGIKFDQYNALKPVSCSNTDDTRDELCGVDIVVNVLDIPFKQICSNAGVSGDSIYEKFTQLYSQDKNVGYNAKTGKFVNMFEAGIIDPAKVTKTALKSAVTVAGTLLTTECAIVNSIED